MDAKSAHHNFEPSPSPCCETVDDCSPPLDLRVRLYKPRVDKNPPKPTHNAFVIMDGYQSHRERSRPPYTRTASRSSTSTRMTSQSANSSTSHISSSPQLHSAHLVHRHHQASHAKPPSSPRPACSGPTLQPQLSRDVSLESARRTPVSSFLQERLQKERQAGAASTPASTSDLAASLELGQSQKSPIKQAMTDANRPQSSSSDPAQRKGLALKEMEQVSYANLCECDLA